jgi:acetylornithine deacetylase/succinyl-diaminopimelate desuccinylase-like protein
MGIPAINYGPGLTTQAHRPDEYVVLADIDAYTQTLMRALQIL